LIKKDITINLKLISEKDHKFLYELLKEREPSMNISHKKMPTFNEHVNFILSKPYLKWYIILQGIKKIGTIYLSKQNEIGLFLKKESNIANIKKVVLKLMIEKNPKKRYLANVNPKNKELIKFFKKNNFKLLQYTYELEMMD
jgi:hypothetical protein